MGRYAICEYYMLGLDNITCHIVSLIDSSVYGSAEPLLVKILMETGRGV